MKNLLLILILTLSFQTLTKADDIRDFQIEGMSIGDSALNFFTKDKIKKNKKNWYKDKKFYGVEFKIKSEKFDQLQLHFKTGDKKYIIHAVGGLVFYKNNINDCYALKEIIDNNIKDIFTDVKFRIRVKENIRVINQEKVLLQILIIMLIMEMFLLAVMIGQKK